jgi:transmembrane sensor
MEDNLRIADLINAYLQQRLTPDEEKELNDWLEAHPENRDIFRKIVNEQNLDTDLALIKSFDAVTALEKIKQFSQSPIKDKVIYIRWARIAAAASIILALSFSGYFLLHNHPTQQTAYYKNDIAPGHNQATLTLANGKKIILVKGLSGNLAQQGNMLIGVSSQNAVAYTVAVANADSPVSYNTLSTAIGEQSPYPLVLADGTKVWLDAESSITFPTTFNGKNRTVKISGEAYFEVAHNVKQPFIVQAGKQTIEDIGTQFDVNAYADEPSQNTTLIEGSVKVNGLLINPGQQTDGQHVKLVNTDVVTAWKTGNFHFEGEPIQTVMRQLTRWYNIDVSYQGEPTKDVFYADISRNRNISAVLTLLENTNGVHFKVEGRRVTVIE